MVHGIADGPRDRDGLTNSREEALSRPTGRISHHTAHHRVGHDVSAQARGRHDDQFGGLRMLLEGVLKGLALVVERGEVSYWAEDGLIEARRRVVAVNAPEPSKRRLRRRLALDE